MKWVAIGDDLQVRVEDGKLEFCSRRGVSLEEAIDVVGFWLRTHENAEAEAWLEKAEDESDLEHRVVRYLEMDSWLGGGTTPQQGRAIVARHRDEERSAQREFIRGEEAFRLGDYDKAIEHLGPLADRGHASACFYMGQLCEKGAGVPKDYVMAYVLFDLAAQGEAPYPTDRAKQRLEELMAAEELKEARRIMGG